MKEFHVLNLGAGVQSTVLYLFFLQGKVPYKLDVAIFADTQEEPEATMAHLNWLRSLNGPPILTPTKGEVRRRSDQRREFHWPAIRSHPRFHYKRRTRRADEAAMHQRI